jgi:Protein of unknown function (DUF3224)
MEKEPLGPVRITASILLCFCFGFAVDAQSGRESQDAIRKEAASTGHAVGTFEVKVTPAPTEGTAQDTVISRMLLDKQFQGDIVGTSKGEMLAAGTGVKGSGAYVAIEKVSGTLKGRKGTFLLQHSGTMTGGVPQMTVTVVPDSGTGQLVGLAGMMTIKIEQGRHSYDFAYTLP